MEAASAARKHTVHESSTKVLNACAIPNLFEIIMHDVPNRDVWTGIDISVGEEGDLCPRSVAVVGNDVVFFAGIVVLECLSGEGSRELHLWKKGLNLLNLGPKNIKICLLLASCEQ